MGQVLFPKVEHFDTDIMQDYYFSFCHNKDYVFIGQLQESSYFGLLGFTA